MNLKLKLFIGRGSSIIQLHQGVVLKMVRKVTFWISTVELYGSPTLSVIAI